MDDKLSEALNRATKSYTIKQEPLTKEYIDILQLRIGDRKKLKDQLPTSY